MGELIIRVIDRVSEDICAAREMINDMSRDHFSEDEDRKFHSTYFLAVEERKLLRPKLVGAGRVSMPSEETLERIRSLHMPEYDPRDTEHTAEWRARPRKDSEGNILKTLAGAGEAFARENSKSFMLTESPEYQRGTYESAGWKFAGRGGILLTYSGGFFQSSERIPMCWLYKLL